MPAVSVIIPNYNHGAFLKERIDSVLNQTFTDYEVIILDDASTDNSKEIIEEYSLNPKISHIIYNENNSGSPFKQWAKGIALAKADWIWIAESDDSANSSFLQKTMKVLQANIDADCCYCDSYLINDNNEVTDKFSIAKNYFFQTDKWSSSSFTKGISELNSSLKYVCTINNASALIFKKSIFTNFEEDIISYRYYGDWFFYINALRLHNIFYLADPLSSCRIHTNSFVNKPNPGLNTKTELFRILRFLLSLPEIHDKKKLTNFFCLRYLGSGWIKEGLKASSLLMSNYIKEDRKLALKIIPKLIWYKLSRRKMPSYISNS
ncbi:MAG: glycosyltransferase [Bacteroidetes bacterium]|nr:glycosyltransferase [Bacteroidota bacterium]